MRTFRFIPCKGEHKRHYTKFKKLTNDELATKSQQLESSTLAEINADHNVRLININEFLEERSQKWQRSLRPHINNDL